MRYASRILGILALLWFGPGQAQTAGGWLPSAEQDAKARETVARFISALDGGRAQEAYDLLTPAMRATTGFPQYESYVQELGNVSGRRLGRQAPKVTWYKDPPRAPLPGVYVSFRIPCAFANLKSCDEDILLHEEPGGRFLVMRSHRNSVRKEAG
jgi:hypothetical protein